MVMKRRWSRPLLMAALTLFGLLSALLGDGAWQVLAWVALAMPLSVMAWHWFGLQRFLPVSWRRTPR